MNLKIIFAFALMVLSGCVEENSSPKKYANFTVNNSQPTLEAEQTYTLKRGLNLLDSAQNIWVWSNHSKDFEYFGKFLHFNSFESDDSVIIFSNNKESLEIRIDSVEIQPLVNEVEHLYFINGGSISPSLVGDNTKSRWPTFKFVEDYFNSNISQVEIERISKKNDYIDLRFHVDVQNKISAVRVYPQSDFLIERANICTQKLSNNLDFQRSDSNKGTEQTHLLYIHNQRKYSNDFLKVKKLLEKLEILDSLKFDLNNSIIYFITG